VLLGLSTVLVCITPAGLIAAESAKSVYLLGSNGSLAGFVPPPGMYFSSINYYYTGSASAEAAAVLSWRACLSSRAC
jgi:hypothetical protein